MPTKLPTEILKAAIEGFESQKRRINSQIDELRQQLRGGRTETTEAPATPAHRRKMSAAGRRRIAAAQKARWAKIKAEA
jgi:cell division septum initiation protein DivIVA